MNGRVFPQKVRCVTYVQTFNGLKLTSTIGKPLCKTKTSLTILHI